MTETAAFFAGMTIGIIFIISTIIAFFWLNIAKAHREQWSMQVQDYSPHREGNIVAFRRR